MKRLKYALIMVIGASSTWAAGQGTIDAEAALAKQQANTHVMNQRDRTIIAAFVGRQLRDAESARFRWQRYNRNGVAYCGWVNAKNAFGAYVGFVPFYLLGAHADGPKGDGRYLPMRAMVGGGEPSNDLLVKRFCLQEGYRVYEPTSDDE